MFNWRAITRILIGMFHYRVRSGRDFIEFLDGFYVYAARLRPNIRRMETELMETGPFNPVGMRAFTINRLSEVIRMITANLWLFPEYQAQKALEDLLDWLLGELGIGLQQPERDQIGPLYPLSPKI